MSTSNAEEPPIKSTVRESSPATYGPARPAGLGLPAGLVLPSGLVLLIGLAAAFLVISGVQAASSLISSVLIAVVLTVAVLPVGRWIVRRGAKGWLAVLAMIASAYLILIVLIGGIALAIAQLVATLPGYSSRVTDLTDQVLDEVSSWGVDTTSTRTALDGLNLGTVVSQLRSVLADALGALGTTAFIVVLMFFMVNDAFGVTARADELRVLAPKVATVLTDFASGTRRYLLVSALFGAIVAVLDAGALWALGVPLALTWGLLSFLTNFVPNVGFVLGVAPPALLALLDQGWGKMVAVLVVYSVLNVVIQTFIQPRYVGESVGLNATASLLALAFWGFALGPLGALLAIPATLLVRAVFIDGNPHATWVLILFGSARKPSTTKPVGDY